LLPGSPPRPGGVAGYAGREFRAYPSMRIADAGRFYAALRPGWDAGQFTELTAAAGLRGGYAIGRMKRAFQRALVLAIAAASDPARIVVEGGEEFDEPGALAALARVLETHPAVTVTFADEVPAALANRFARVVAAGEARA